VKEIQRVEQTWVIGRITGLDHGSVKRMPSWRPFFSG